MMSSIGLEQLCSKEINDDTQTGNIPKPSVSTTVDVSTREASVHNNSIEPESLQLQPDNDTTIIDGDIDLFLKSKLEQVQVKLALSEDINDVADVFRQLECRIGEQELVLAIMISVIRERRLWKKYGYDSMNKFLDDLPSVCKVSRQTFNNAAQAGMVIRHLTAPYLEAAGLKPEFALTPVFLYRNYTKIIFLYRIMFTWNLSLTNEVLDNFSNMTYREFENFVKNYKFQNQAEISRLAEDSTKSSVNKPAPRGSEALRAASKKAVLPDLTEEEKTICRKIITGHNVSFLFTSNPECVKSVLQFLSDVRKHEFDKICKGTRTPSELFMKDNPDLCLNDVNWAEFFPDNLHYTIETLEKLISVDLAPHDIKNAFAKSFKTRAELTLVQAYLLYRMGHDLDLQKSLLDYLSQNKIDCPYHDLVMSFAVNVLDIGIPRYKQLKRIGIGLECLTAISLNPDLKKKVHFTSEGFLEKLSYLQTAMKTHTLNYPLVVHALNTVSARRFRQFARNKYDNLSSDPITMQDYLKAKPFIEQLQHYLAEGKPVSVIGLQSEGEQAWINTFNFAMEPGHENLKNRYPSIIWDSSAHIEHALEPNLQSEESQFEEASRDSLIPDYDPLPKAA